MAYGLAVLIAERGSSSENFYGGDEISTVDCSVPSISPSAPALRRYFGIDIIIACGIK